MSCGCKRRITGSRCCGSKSKAYKEVENIAAQRRTQFESGISAAELQFDILCRSVLAEQRNSLERQLLEAEALRRACSEDFLRARRQREVIGTLRHHQLEDYQQEEARREQRRLDDLF